jgi:hypothetical protein
MSLVHLVNGLLICLLWHSGLIEVSHHNCIIILAISLTLMMETIIEITAIRSSSLETLPFAVTVRSIEIGGCPHGPEALRYQHEHVIDSICRHKSVTGASDAVGAALALSENLAAASPDVHQLTLPLCGLPELKVGEDDVNADAQKPLSASSIIAPPAIHGRSVMSRNPHDESIYPLSNGNGNAVGGGPFGTSSQPDATQLVKGDPMTIAGYNEPLYAVSFNDEVERVLGYSRVE